MHRLIIRCLPTAMRRRHADEIEELLESTQRPVRDGADLVLVAVGLRLGRYLRELVLVALIFFAAAVAAVVVAISELSNGPAGILHHWWSTFAVLAVATSLVAVTVLVAAQRRAREWQAPR